MNTCLHVSELGYRSLYLLPSDTRAGLLLEPSVPWHIQPASHVCRTASQKMTRGRDADGAAQSFRIHGNGKIGKTGTESGSAME